MRLVDNSYFLFTVSLTRSASEADVVHVTAWNVDNEDEYTVDIYPTDIYGQFAEYFSHFCSSMLNEEGKTPQKRTSAVPDKIYKLTKMLMVSRTKFMQSLLWLKLLISQAIKEEGTGGAFTSGSYIIGSSELSIVGKFVPYAPSKLRSREGPAALVLGIGNEGSHRLEYGIQMPRVVRMAEESTAAGQTDYLKQYELLYGKGDEKRELTERQALADELDKDRAQTQNYSDESERVKMLEKECEELKRALREMQQIQGKKEAAKAEGN